MVRPLLVSSNSSLLHKATQAVPSEPTLSPPGQTHIPEEVDKPPPVQLAVGMHVNPSGPITLPAAQLVIYIEELHFEPSV